FPATTVVTPWLTFGVMSGIDRSARSSCVWASTKPGATMRSVASISRARGLRLTSPTATIRSAAMPTSTRRRGAPVPSTRRPLRMTSSTSVIDGIPLDDGGFHQLPEPLAVDLQDHVGVGRPAAEAEPVHRRLTPCDPAGQLDGHVAALRARHDPWLDGDRHREWVGGEDARHPEVRAYVAGPVPGA